LIAFSCVPVQQQIIDNQNEKLRHYELLQLTINNDEFIETMNPEANDYDISVVNGQLNIYPELMERNFQSGFSIPGYGSIYAGKLTRKYNHQDADPFEVIEDNLLFTINYGGGNSPSELVIYKLIWNGEYYLKNNMLTVDLVLSFKDLDPRRANVYNDVRFNLTPLQTNKSEQLNINFLGYDKPINYKY